VDEMKKNNKILHKVTFNTCKYVYHKLSNKLELQGGGLLFCNNNVTDNGDIFISNWSITGRDR
jgi:hypothetical protein